MYENTSDKYLLMSLSEKRLRLARVVSEANKDNTFKV